MTDETQDSALPEEAQTRKHNFLGLRDTRRAAAHSAAYSRAVGVLRWALPLAVLMVLVALIVLPMIQAKKITAAVAEAVPNLVVEKLNLTGLDAKNQPYSLTAAKALQAENAKNVIDLEMPQGDIALENGAWLAGKAQYGRYDQENKRLWLGGNVELFHDQGYQFTTSEAQVDMSQNTAWGDQPVLIQGAFGEIRGQGFRVLEKGNVVVIKGHAQALLNLQTAKPSDKPSAKSTGSQKASPQ
ncbi:MAG: LPS export ABC transporter periplasmic protein LptC [Alphaproteobacteria bacterium]|nr:LPS export ABC transporter periplasmic protein LptC [Alphaproteobacteria bacterium]